MMDKNGAYDFSNYRNKLRATNENTKYSAGETNVCEDVIQKSAHGICNQSMTDELIGIVESNLNTDKVTK